MSVTPTVYIRSSPWRIDLHGGSPERKRCSWWLLMQPIKGPHPDGETYTLALLKNESTPNGHTDNLYLVLTLMARLTWKTLLTAYIGSSHWRLRPTLRSSWKTKTLLTVTLTADRHSDKKIITCKSCSYVDPKYLHPQWQLRRVYIHVHLHQARGWLLITNPKDCNRNITLQNSL